MKRLFKRILFYVLSWTWGILTTLPGAICIVVCALCGRAHVFHGRVYGTVGKNWGGVELGCFFLCSQDCQTDYLRAHESGHGLQNIILGPLMVFLVCIPSAVRYWYRRLKYENKGLTPPTSYDSIWFEKWATDWGYKYILTDRW